MTSVEISSGDRNLGTYVQERVKRLSEAATSIYNVVHVLDYSVLGNLVFENDRIACTSA